MKLPILLISTIQVYSKSFYNPAFIPQIASYRPNNIDCRFSSCKKSILSTTTARTSQLNMSFYSDSSDYKSSDTDYDSDDDSSKNDYGVPVQDGDNSEAESPSIEESPVPLSKNAGNRFIALVFDRALADKQSSSDDVDVLELHERRIALTEDHIMFCRKANLYNETFNSDSMADIIWSHQILASDLKRTIGHVLCIESKELKHAQEALSRDPIVQYLTGGEISNIPLYRWRHIRDHTLRQDDGRNGTPYMLIAMDRSAEEGVGDLRESMNSDHLEYLIRSERIIAAGSLHLPTEFKDDPSSIAVGDLILFNAIDRDHAIDFVENDPSALAGLYGNMRVHRYNSLDVTGKFVAENLLHDSANRITSELKEALAHWGYPVEDRETPWLNW
jgi:uncharacterized protein YciI